MYIFDIETLYNFFSFTGKFEGRDEIYAFELSERKNQRNELIAHLNHLQQLGATLVGYNSLGFDWPIIQELMVNQFTFDYKKAYNMCQDIINGSNYGNAGFHQIRYSDRLIPQLDLVKLNHFDNRAKRTRLKDLEFAMRLPRIEDMPVPLGEPISFEQMDKVLEYNAYDVQATEQFLQHCKPAIEMRMELIQQGILGGDVLNYSDVKIGCEYLIRRIGRNKCFIKGSTPKQTKRSMIQFKDIILPHVYFRTEPFEKMLDWFKEQKIYVDSRQRPKLETDLAGLKFHFGVGGVHASVNSKVYRSNDEYQIVDVDVAGMYPAVAVANGFAPEHLGEDFSMHYKQLSLDRKQYPKGTTMNALLKLANNGVFGNSNNPYSPFYDPKFTFSITVNGQVQLMQLVERISMIPNIELIQANTDGVTVYMPKAAYPWFKTWCQDWEELTGLKLEETNYSAMWIRDVNNYLAVKPDGELKLKGAYWWPKNWKDYEGWWNKNFSSLCVQKVAAQSMVKGADPSVLLKLVTNPYDFMLRYKTTRGAKVYIGDKEQQSTTRYYVSTSGEPMKKIAKPKGEIGAYKRKNKLTDEYFNRILGEIPEGTWDERIHTKNKSKYTEVVTKIESGKLVKECNNMENFDWNDLDYDYYLDQINKLIIGD